MNMQLYPVPASSLALAAVAKKSDTPRATDWHSAERQVTHREKNEPKTKEILSKSLYRVTADQYHTERRKLYDYSEWRSN